MYALSIHPHSVAGDGSRAAVAIDVSSAADAHPTDNTSARHIPRSA
jgi:hypothetical protein